MLQIVGIANGGGIRGDRTYNAGTTLTRKDVLTELRPVRDPDRSHHSTGNRHRTGSELQSPLRPLRLTSS